LLALIDNTPSARAEYVDTLLRTLNTRIPATNACPMRSNARWSFTIRMRDAALRCWRESKRTSRIGVTTL
jgi:hypothetical protein